MIETAPSRPIVHIEDEAAAGIAQIEDFLRREAAAVQPGIETSLGLGGIAAETARLRTAVGDTSSFDVSSAAELPEDLAREQYNRSLRTYRHLGRLAGRGCLQSPEGQAARENVRRDLVTSLAEMFENGDEFRGGFEVSDIYTYQVVDGQVQYMTADGLKPLRQVVEEGAMVSAAAAKRDPLMIPQAERDAADVHNAVRVDEMVAGRTGTNTRLVVSRDLGEIIKEGSPYRSLYMGKGYRDGLTFLQLYFAEGGKMTAGTFSVDGVSDAVFNAVLAKRGVHFPKGESRHQSVRYGVELGLPDKAAAIEYIREFRRECYALQGDTRRRRSASEFIKERAAEIDSYIDALGVPLGISVDSQVKHKAIHDFVVGLLQKPEHMKPEVVAHLRRIRDSESFSDDDGRRLSGIILYAIAEALYEGARHFMTNRPQPTNAAPETSGWLAPWQVIGHLSSSVHRGVEAGRSHGGPCPGEVALSNKPKDGLKNPFNPQGAFGGLEGDDKEPGAIDKYGSMFFNCPNPKCKKENERYYNKLRTHCQHCKKEIPRC